MHWYSSLRTAQLDCYERYEITTDTKIKALGKNELVLTPFNHLLTTKTEIYCKNNRTFSDYLKPARADSSLRQKASHGSFSLNAPDRFHCSISNYQLSKEELLGHCAGLLLKQNPTHEELQGYIRLVLPRIHFTATHYLVISEDQ